MTTRAAGVRRTPARLALAFALGGLLLLAGCAGLGRRGGDITPAEVLAGRGTRTRRVEKIAGRGLAAIENRLGRIEIDFELAYEPGGKLELNGYMAPGFLPFHGTLRLVSTPETTLAYANDMPLVPSGKSYPGRVLYPALLAVLLGGDWVLNWLETSGCDLDQRVSCGGLDFEFRLDEETGRIKAWSVEDGESHGSYEGFLYDTVSSGVIDLPQILTGMAHPYEIAVYVKYDQIDATMK